MDVSTYKEKREHRLVLVGHRPAATRYTHDVTMAIHASVDGIRVAIEFPRSELREFVADLERIILEDKPFEGYR